MTKTTLTRLLDDCCAAVAEATRLPVEQGYWKEIYLRPLKEPKLSLRLQKASLQDSGLGRQMGQALLGLCAEVTLVGELFLPVSRSLQAEEVFCRFFEALSEERFAFTEFTLGQADFLENAQCLCCKMTAKGRVFLPEETKAPAIRTVRLQREEDA